MATAQSQRRWRAKNRFNKTQLNVMVPRLVHDDLSEISSENDLRGKGEAVSFASFVAKGLAQYANHDPHAAQLLEIFRNSYGRDRDLYH